MPCFVLTGGPGGGKSTLMRELHTSNPYRWIFVPETAPLLFQAGFDARDKSFQRAVVNLQIATEDICGANAKAEQILLCHRGTLDALAYWLRNTWGEEEFFDFVGISREEHFHRYDAIIHLQTAAIGAEGYYHNWPDAHRPETLEQAADIDRLCARAWGAHPQYILIDNEHRDWKEKSQAAYAHLDLALNNFEE